MTRAFCPGKHDCALFAAGCVAAMTGDDFAAPYRGRYRTLRGGIRILRKAGFSDAIALAAAHLPPVAPAFAADGDVAVVPTPEGPALGILIGAQIRVAGPKGLRLVPREAATDFYKVN